MESPGYESAVEFRLPGMLASNLKKGQAGTMNVQHDPLSAALEIREQLASQTRRLGLFLGAGTSMAAGFPGILELTGQIGKRLNKAAEAQYAALLKELPKGTNVKTVLDKIRTIRELIGDNAEKKYDGLNGAAAKNLDVAICQAISDIIRETAPKERKAHLTLAHG